MNRIFGAALLLLLPLLASCSGGGSAPAPLPVPVQSQAVNRTATDSIQRSSLPYSLEYLYVANTASANAGPSINIYAHDANGDVAPLGIIQGSKTLLNNPTALSQDAAGNLYVANGSSVLVFAHGSNGNVAPIRMLAGPQTGITNIGAMTVDKATGKLFIGNINLTAAPGYVGAILRFPPNATRNTAPFATSLDSGWPYSMTQDSTGNNLIEFVRDGPEDLDQVIGTFGKQFANGTFQSAEPYSLSGMPRGSVFIADDPSTKTYLVSVGYLIYRFPEKENGSFDHLAYLSLPIVSEITMPNATSSSSIAVQSAPYANTYVVEVASYQNQVAVYNNAANGNATPIRLLKGPATLLTRPRAIVEGP